MYSKMFGIFLYPYYVVKLIYLIDLIVTVYIYPLLYIQSANLSSSTPLQPYCAASFIPFFFLLFIFPGFIIKIHPCTSSLFFWFSSNPLFLSFLLYLITFPPPIILTIKNILPIFPIATVLLIPVHVWRRFVFHYLIFKSVFQCSSL